MTPAIAPPRRALMPAILILSTILLIALLFAFSVGSASFSWRELVAEDSIAATIVLKIRVPRVLAAALVGAILAVAGLTFQTLLRNPLADPFILGVSGGAAAGAAVATALGWSRFPGLVQVIAFAGASAATAAVFLLARRRDHTDPTRLLLSGLVLNAFFSAVILMAFSFSKQSDLTGALRWMMGTLFGATWTEVVLLAVFLAAAMVMLSWMASDLRMLVFGEEDAKARGIDVERIKLAGFVCGSLITGAAVSVSGIIGFIGLLVPHLIRLIWRRDFRFLLPLAALGGATLLVAADVVSRIAVPAAELPVAALTALLGVPLFLSLLRREA
ncbi:MAG TPA: iron ABC transporter permease [Thermoanaerobaculia bacterium]|nr:iron ABC transporter permease [Thermoanaerobaculia bacterium]